MIKKYTVFILIFLVIAIFFIVVHNYTIGIISVIATLPLIVLQYKHLSDNLREATSQIKYLRNGKQNNNYIIRKGDDFADIKEQLNNLSDEIFPMIKNRKDIADQIKNIIDLMDSPVILLDHDGRIVLYNRASEIFMRTSCNNCFYYELLKNTILLNTVEHCLNANPGNYEFKTEGKIYQINSFRNVYIAGKKLIFCVFNDITLLRKKDNLEREFISAVSHELKTPLSVILGMSEILNEEEISDKERKKYIKSVMKNAERMNELIKKLLILIEIRASKKINKDRINLKECTETVLENERSYAKNKNITIKTDLKDVWIPGDKFLLTEMIRNIVNNAIRYTDKGYVAIKVSKNSFATVTIRDSGIGIDSEILPHLFEPFYRGDNSRTRASGGTGLGLTIAKRIATLHSGNITVKSSIGEGTKFTIQFPMP